MLYFSHAGEMPMGQLSERLLVHPTSVTSTVDTLQRLGYVRRVPHPTDRRATLARITAKGRRAVETSIGTMAAAALRRRRAHERPGPHGVHAAGQGPPAPAEHAGRRVGPHCRP